jgi:16S rRNA (cytosine967-C5)-methyltransferase
MISPARIAALEALRAVANSKSDLPAAVAAVRPGLLDERDRGLATELVTGTLRWQNELDFLISRFAERPLEKMDADVLHILRLGAYQILHLDRVPAAAAVNDAVALTRRVKKSSAAGLVNAVLRKLSRTEREALPLPGRDAAPLDFLEIALSHPRWLASRWLERFGLEGAEIWERFNNTPAPLTLRVNPLKTNAARLTEDLAAHGVGLTPARYAPDGLIVTAGNPLRTPLAHTGQFFVQDEASQLVALLAMPRPGDLILDACASPGGKTTAIAAAAPDASIVAADVRDARMQLLRETVASSGAANVRLIQSNLEYPLPFRETFDAVFVDAPCSGLGTLRRDPDIRWRRREDDLRRFRASQITMLQNAAAVVKPGGRVIYSTCSSEPEENDDVVEEFLATAANRFERLDRREMVPALGPVLDDAGFFRTSPIAHGLEAFFGAVLQRL